MPLFFPFPANKYVHSRSFSSQVNLKFKYWKRISKKQGLYLPSLHWKLFQTSGQQFYMFCIDFHLLAPSNKTAKPRDIQLSSRVFTAFIAVDTPSTGTHTGMFNLASQNRPAKHQLEKALDNILWRSS